MKKIIAISVFSLILSGCLFDQSDELISRWPNDVQPDKAVAYLRRVSDVDGNYSLSDEVGEASVFVASVDVDIRRKEDVQTNAMPINLEHGAGVNGGGGDNVVLARSNDGYVHIVGSNYVPPQAFKVPDMVPSNGYIENLYVGAASDSGYIQNLGITNGRREGYLEASTASGPAGSVGYLQQVGSGSASNEGYLQNFGGSKDILYNGYL